LNLAYRLGWGFPKAQTDGIDYKRLDPTCDHWDTNNLKGAFQPIEYTPGMPNSCRLISFLDAKYVSISLNEGAWHLFNDGPPITGPFQVAIHRNLYISLATGNSSKFVAIKYTFSVCSVEDWEAGQWNPKTQLPPGTFFVQFVLVHHFAFGPNWPDGDYTQPVSWYDASITPLEQ
jgi:hypothetical protein